MKKIILSFCLSTSFFYINSNQLNHENKEFPTEETTVIQNIESIIRAQDLTLYIGSGCPYCKKVMNFLQSNKLESFVTIKDVWMNRSYMDELTAMTRGKRTVPCLMLDASKKEYMHGSQAIITTLQELLIP